MVRIVKVITGALCALLLILALSTYALYRTATAVPAEYAAALRLDDESLEAERRELECQIAALYSDAQRRADQAPRVWEATVTDAQINGWLATRAPVEFPELEDAGVNDPRVVIDDAGVMLAFRARRRQIDAVVTLRAAPFVAEDGRLGVQLTDARLGVAPLPIGRIVELAREALAGVDLPAEWSRTEEGQPALLVDFETIASDSRQRRTLAEIRHGDGQLYVAGRTTRREERVASQQAVGE